MAAYPRPQMSEWPLCPECGEPMRRFEWHGPMSPENGTEMWHWTCINPACSDQAVYIRPAPPACQRCSYAYLRKHHPPEKAIRYNYEACSLGVLPMLPRLPDAWRCWFYLP